MLEHNGFVKAAATVVRMPLGGSERHMAQDAEALRLPEDRLPDHDWGAGSRYPFFLVLREVKT